MATVYKSVIGGSYISGTVSSKKFTIFPYYWYQKPTVNVFPGDNDPSKIGLGTVIYWQEYGYTFSGNVATSSRTNAPDTSKSGSKQTGLYVEYIRNGVTICKRELTFRGSNTTTTTGSNYTAYYYYYYYSDVPLTKSSSGDYLPGDSPQEWLTIAPTSATTDLQIKITYGPAGDFTGSCAYNNYIATTPTVPTTIAAGNSGTVSVSDTYKSSLISGYVKKLVITAGSTSLGTKYVSSSSGSVSFTTTVSNYTDGLTSSASSRSVSFTIYTYFGSSSSDCTSANLIHYGVVSCPFTCNESAYNPQPTVTISDESGMYDTTGGSYVAGISYLHIIVDGGCRYNASVASCTIVADGTSYNTTEVTTGTLSTVGARQITVTVTDTRGSVVTVTKNINVIEWFTPEIPTFAIHRGYYVGGVWTANDSGDYCKIDWGINVAPVNNTNSVSVEIYAPDGTHTITPTGTDRYTASGVIYSEASTESSYNITIRVTDNYSSFSRTSTLSTAGVIMDFRNGGKGIGLGKVAEVDSYVDVNPEWTLRAYNVMIGSQTLADYIKSVISGS